MKIIKGRKIIRARHNQDNRSRTTRGKHDNMEFLRSVIRSVAVWTKRAHSFFDVIGFFLVYCNVLFNAVGRGECTNDGAPDGSTLMDG